jgi:hypothetical protein
MFIHQYIRISHTHFQPGMSIFLSLPCSPAPGCRYKIYWFSYCANIINSRIATFSLFIDSFLTHTHLTMETVVNDDDVRRIMSANIYPDYHSLTTGSIVSRIFSLSLTHLYCALVMNLF